MDTESFDWNNKDSIFARDDTYENINAPQWIDLSADQPANDEAWFCNLDCRHPRTVEDFWESTCTSSKVQLLRSATISGILQFRNGNYKYPPNPKLPKGVHSSSAEETCIRQFTKTKKLNSQRQLNENSENQNPNMPTPSANTKSRLRKAMTVTSMENRKLMNYSPVNSSQSDRKPKLRSAFSARNLNAGKEILNQITGFCRELKNLVRKKPVGAKKGTMDKFDDVASGEMKNRVSDRERVPLLGVKDL